MKSPRKYILALGAFFVAAAVAVAGCGTSVPGNAVAVVAGNPITQKAFNHWMYVDAKGQQSSEGSTPVIVPNDPPNFNQCVAQVRKEIPSLKTTATKTIQTDCKQLFTSLSGQVMDFLIKAYWYQAQAHKQGIDITTAQVQQALTTARKGQYSTNAAFQAFLTESGQTQDDVLYRVRVSQVYKKLLAKYPTTVSQADIASYYAAHKSSFGSAQKRNLRIVLAKTEAQAAAAKKALQSGQSWKVVAKKYSIDSTTKDNGGLLTGVTAGQQDATLSQAAFSAKLKTLVGPVKSQYGYYVIQVIAISPATQQTLTQASATIKSTLSTQKQSAAQTAIDAAAKKAWLSKTSCRAQYAMADCKGYKAPKTASTSGATATAG